MTDRATGHANVLKFRSLVDSDPILQADVEQYVGNGVWDSAAIVQIGAGRGLDFTADELAAVMDEDDELSDFELELVAAASVSTCYGGGV